jgi:hypothetical protein
MQFDRRNFLATLAGSMATGAGLVRWPLAADAARAQDIPPVPPTAPVQAVARAQAAPPGVPLWQDALAALDRHAPLVQRDRLAIADFSLSSAQPRFHLVDLHGGTVDVLHVTHGSGSDPQHTGWLQSFSNRPGSNATSEGAYLTCDYYQGRHGWSQRLEGLDPSNDMAMDRAIVFHAADYAEPRMLAQIGKLGRSQGCLAFSEAGLNQVFEFLGEGRLILTGKA